MTEPHQPHEGWRERVHEIIFEADTPTGKAFDIGLIVAIVLSVIVVMVSTMPEAQGDPYETWFHVAEWVFTIIFTVEYAVRLLVVRRPVKYATSFFGVIDLLSILPAFIGLIVPGGERLLVVRTLRLLRVFRVFKLVRYLKEASSLRRALYESRHKLAVFLTTVVIVLVIASTLMHVVEGSAEGANPAFQSLPDSLYWAVITMTTVGYGDITPVTAFGKAITGALVLMGYAMIIVPTGVLSAEMAGSAATRDQITTTACPSCMKHGHAPNATFCKFCGEKL